MFVCKFACSLMTLEILCAEQNKRHTQYQQTSAVVMGNKSRIITQLNK